MGHPHFGATDALGNTPQEGIPPDMRHQSTASLLHYAPDTIKHSIHTTQSVVKQLCTPRHLQKSYDASKRHVPNRDTDLPPSATWRQPTPCFESEKLPPRDRAIACPSTPTNRPVFVRTAIEKWGRRWMGCPQGGRGGVGDMKGCR